MSTGNVNKKSAQLAARVPHEVIEEMDAVKLEHESTANFIVTAMRGEIARRKAEGSIDNALLSSLDALTRIEEIGSKASDDVRALVDIARRELQRRKAKPETPET